MSRSSAMASNRWRRPWCHASAACRSSRSWKQLCKRTRKGNSEGRGMTDTDQCRALQFDRHDILGIPPMYMQLQVEGPVARVRTPTGDQAWLVTRHEEVRYLFSHDSVG